MRGIINTSIFICFALIVFNAQGQDVQQVHTRKLSVSASATIIDNLSLITMRDINLASPTAVENKIFISPITSPFSGLMRINGRPGASIRITYLSTETLLEQKGTGGVVQAVYKISGYESDNQAASILLDIGEANVRLGKDGTYFIWLGANIDITKATPGEYISEFIIEMEAN